MLSKAKIKYIQSLDLKKNRDSDKVFIAEGFKIVEEFIEKFRCRLLLGTHDWLNAHPHIQAEEIIEVSQEELSRASLQKTPQEVLGVFEQPRYQTDFNTPQKELCLALDTIQNPGNLGTIVRLADWFGIEHIFCSPNTVDIFNPKTIQATMGALARVQVHYCSLTDLVKNIPSTPVYGTFLDGENIYKKTLPSYGLIIMGNEGKGISPELEKFINNRLFIPNYPIGRPTSESLNVAIATAIVCAEFRRQNS